MVGLLGFVRRQRGVAEKEKKSVRCCVVLWECGGVKSEEGGGTTGIRSRALYKVVDVI